MDLWNLASKNLSLQHFTQECYIKHNLTENISCLVLKLIYYYRKTSSDDEEKRECFDCTNQHVTDLLNTIEAIFLHGLKEKLRFNRVLNKSVRDFDHDYRLDFWSILLILSHNQVSESINQITNITSDIGRCRAWLRIAFNDSLFSSYLEALINDKSLLHGFYKPYAYLRDKENVKCFKKLMKALEMYEFKLDYNHSSLNNWSSNTFKLIAVQSNVLTPVVAAVDALSTLKSDSKKDMTVKKKSDHNSGCFNKLLDDSKSTITEINKETCEKEANISSIFLQSDMQKKTEAESNLSQVLKINLITEETNSVKTVSREEDRDKSEFKLKGRWLLTNINHNQIA